jgi:hypothetical protein
MSMQATKTIMTLDLETLIPMIRAHYQKKDIENFLSNLCNAKCTIILCSSGHGSIYFDLRMVLPYT